VHRLRKDVKILYVNKQELSASSWRTNQDNEGSFILHILSYHDSPLVRLNIFVVKFYVYFVVTRTDLLVVVCFTI
jgi:hypothetical protein